VILFISHISSEQNFSNSDVTTVITSLTDGFLLQISGSCVVIITDCSDQNTKLRINQDLNEHNKELTNIVYITQLRFNFYEY